MERVKKMKKLLFLLFFGFTAQADSWCDIKSVATKAVLSTYQGVCNQKLFGGPWGNPADTTHVPNLTKQSEVDALIVADAMRSTARAAKLTKIKTACSSQTAGLMKDMCDFVLDGQ